MTSLGSADGRAFLDALVDSVRAVVPPAVRVTRATTFDETTLDSLGLLEVMVHLERATSLSIDEEIVREVSLDPAFSFDISLCDFAHMLWDALAASTSSSGNADNI